MPAKVGYLVIDAADPAALARFWCGLLAVTVDTEIGDGEFLVLSPTEDGLTVGFQRVTDAKRARTGSTSTWWSTTSTGRPRKSRSSAAAGSNRETPASSRASSGAAWPTPRATNSTSMSSPPRRLPPDGPCPPRRPIRAANPSLALIRLW
jgi:hypothetical protein